MSALVVVEQVGSEYYIKTSKGLTISANDKKVVATDGGTTKSTISFSSGDINIACGNTKVLRYNTAGAAMFRFYATGSMGAVSLFKLA